MIPSLETTFSYLFSLGFS